MFLVYQIQPVIEQLSKICHDCFIMSSVPSNKNKAFALRLIETAGSDKPADISSLFDISYQAAKNYVNGKRLPDSRVLLRIAEKTEISIHWLLTGEGEKYVDDSTKEELLTIAEKLSALIGKEFMSEFGKLLISHLSENRHTSTLTPKTVKLASDHIWEEKERDIESVDLPVNPS